MKQALGFGLALVIVSNSFTFFVYAVGIERQLVYIPWAIIALSAALLWARGPGKLSWAEVGFNGVHWKRSAGIGVLCGLVLAIPLLMILAFPILFAEPVRYREIQNLDVRGLLWRLGVELTIATAITEEVLFRGILQALFKRALSSTPALISTNVVFALWHLGVNALSLQQNMPVLPLLPAAVTQVIGYLGSLIAVGFGGMIFSVLRERTNHLAASITMHWITVAALTVLIYRG
jgi:membrane protease YdiL (CAAX protease family)